MTTPECICKRDPEGQCGRCTFLTVGLAKKYVDATKAYFETLRRVPKEMQECCLPCFREYADDMVAGAVGMVADADQFVASAIFGGMTAMLKPLGVEKYPKALKAWNDLCIDRKWTSAPNR